MALRAGVQALGLLALLALVAVAWGAAPPPLLTEQQKAKLAERDRLEKSLPRLLGQKQNDKVIVAMARIVTLEKQVFGETDPEVVASLERLAARHEVLEQFPAAIKVREELLRLQEKRLGKGHWEITDARIALEFARRRNALTAEERVGLRQAAAWTQQVHQLYRQGKAMDAIPLLLKVREVYKKVLGELHYDYVGSMNNLAVLYRENGEHARALPLFLEAHHIFRKMLGERHPAYVSSLNNLAVVYRDMGEDGRALPLYLEAREICEKVLGERHPLYAITLTNMAMLYKDMGEHTKALPLFLEVRDIRKKIQGERHPTYGTSLNNLAGLYQDMGEHARALPLLLEARDIVKKVLSERHPLYAQNANNLGMLYQKMGEYAKALPLYVEARDINKKVLGEHHPYYAATLNNLATLYQDMGEHARALPLLLESRDIRKKVVGERHPSYALSLNSLANLYNDMGEYAKALPLLLKARDIRKKVLGERHPSYATSLNSLAFLHRDRKEYTKALPLFLEARDINKKVLGERHPHYATSLNNLAWLYMNMGKPKQAMKSSQEALRALEGYLDDGFGLLGDRQRNQILQNVLHNLGLLLSLQEEAERPAAERYAAVLSWKGRVASWGTLDRLALNQPALKETVEQLQEARARLARFALQTPTPAQQAAWLREVQALTEHKERLEAELARRSSEFRKQNERRSLTPEQLAKELPGNVAFVDLIEFTHFTAPGAGKGKPQIEQRLLAFVSRRGKEVVAVPLGAQKPVADAVARWRAEVEKAPRLANRATIDRAGKALRDAVWQPLMKHVGDAKTVIVAPDGVLCQFPLAALPGSKSGSYLIEERALAQVSSAAHLFDLLAPMDGKPREGKGLLALGGVDYGEGKPYGPLPGTVVEARRCRDLFRKTFTADSAVLLSGKEATTAALRKGAAASPRYLHLATHGYFEPPDRVERLLRGLDSREDAGFLRSQQAVTLSNLPGLRCGLALAGANQPPPADDPNALPGVLTGQDVEALDLRGCEVAVLSACQTELGDVARSQGVLGLQRAFHKAGAKTLVTSLWSVQDGATAELMDEFYSRLWGKKKITRLEALRQAQLAILRNPERVRQRSATLLADARKRGVPEEMLRGPKGRYATDLPEGGKIDTKPARSPEAWWAAFVLSGEWR
jgi:CHAT domain-containing protein